ncbi:MAG: hypothetical protein NTX82_02000 [Candidatus Parcubacteria bacterium]|nr:hypothetical protein [Candidatus Parcubacteria bacterium]
MNNELNKNEIIKVQAKPMASPAPTGKTKTGGLRIGKVDTLNLVVEPLKKRYTTHYKDDKIHLIVDLVLGAIILILLGVMVNLWIFSRARINLMDFKVTANPETLTNGQETEFIIDYANTSKDTLSNVSLVLKIPTSLQNPEYDIKDFDIKTNTLKIGDLNTKANGQFKVKGFLLGNFGDNQEFIAAITYQDKYGLKQQEFFSNKFQFTDSVLKAEVQLPAKIIANSRFTLQTKLQNTSSLDLNKLKIKMTWPENFTFIDSDLEKMSTNSWLVGELMAGAQTEPTFTGRISGDTATELNFQTEILATYNNEEYVLAQIKNSATLGFSNLAINFINIENNKNIAPGGKTTYTLAYKNNESYTLENIEIGLIVSGDYANTAFLADQYKRAKGNTVIFNQNDYPKLAKLEPGQEGTIEVQAAAKNSISFGAVQENGYRLQTNILASYDDSNLKTRITLESEPVYTIIDSQLSLKTTAMFYTNQGDQIGVGSVPPVVGEYTSYWVIIKINNTNNKIKDLKVTAKVPAGIEFTNIYNVTDGDQINFNESTRQLEWHVANVNALAGILNPSPEARIQLAITPTPDQVSKSPLLMSNISATATDTLTNSFLSASGQNVSTAIFSDQGLNKVVN